MTKTTLREENEKISRNLHLVTVELERQKGQMRKLIYAMTKEYQDDAAQGDFQESAAFTEAASKLTEYNLAVRAIEERLAAVKEKVREKNDSSVEEELWMSKTGDLFFYRTQDKR